MMFQHFWSRWSKKCLVERQRRNKWGYERENLQIGQLVLIKDDNLPPLVWKLGRIVELFPGPENKVRVVKIKTQRSELKRAITKLCPQPIDRNQPLCVRLISHSTVNFRSRDFDKEFHNK
ncbi:hypothetical protein NQ317_013387 [Molorchus minor]|uniref:DUF5641 domain-containing protein n=1 Tax=Molorchus minor TaxID=1323400 RepID=A0ABQ9J7I9_9CUCU|nr:hypothetical protein NQ317_013387 [Molorchus minor]